MGALTGFACVKRSALSTHVGVRIRARVRLRAFGRGSQLVRDVANVGNVVRVSVVGLVGAHRDHVRLRRSARRTLIGHLLGRTCKGGVRARAGFVRVAKLGFAFVVCRDGRCFADVHDRSVRIDDSDHIRDRGHGGDRGCILVLEGHLVFVIDRAFTGLERLAFESTLATAASASAATASTTSTSAASTAAASSASRSRSTAATASTAAPSSAWAPSAASSPAASIASLVASTPAASTASPSAASTPSALTASP